MQEYQYRHPARCRAVEVTEDLTEADLEEWPGVELMPWGVTVPSANGGRVPVMAGHYLVLTASPDDGVGGAPLYAIQDSGAFEAEWEPVA